MVKRKYDKKKYLHIVMATISIDQGDIYNKQKIAKQINKGDSIYEGFVTVNSIKNNRNSVNNLNAEDKQNVISKVTNFNKNITEYRNDYKALNERTQSYINNAVTSASTEKNYNVFINKDLTQTEIREKNHKGCVDVAAVNNLTEDPGFKLAYPTKFASYDAAKDACKLWAADTGNTVFAINKDISGNYKCYTGETLQTTLTQHIKPKTLYKVLAGTASSVLGGLFGNGQIGVWAGNQASSRWNIPNMAPAKLIKKYNSTSSFVGSQGYTQAVTDNWWGFPGAGGWGQNKFPNKIAWWISTANITFVGEMGYFYYVYNSPIAKTIKIYMVIDDAGELNINGINSTIAQFESGGWVHTVALKAGKNVIRHKLVNTGGPGAFVLYAYDERKPTAQQVLFMSGPGWGYSSSFPTDYNSIVNVVVDSNNQTAIKTLNSVPAGYTICDPVDGGGINKSTLSASYGVNCSNVTNPPLNIRYIRVTPNGNGDFIQIRYLQVNAFVNGVSTNITSRGTATAANKWNADYGPEKAAGESMNNGVYISGSARQDNWWQLDLGQDYLVSEIIYNNRAEDFDRANGMKLTLTANSGAVFGPIILTAASKQNFNVTDKGLTAASPITVGQYQYSKAEAAAVCTARGARLCTKAELNNSDFCSCGWASDGDTPGYPMAHGDQTGKGWCGGDNGGKVWRDCGAPEWTDEAGNLFNYPVPKKPDGIRRGSAHCCK